MKQTCIKLVLPLVLAFLMAAVSFGSIYTQPVRADNLTTQRNQLTSLKDKYSKAASEAASLKNQIASKRAQIQTKYDEKLVLDEEIGVLTEQIKLAESLIEEYSAEISSKETEKAALEEKQAVQNEMLAEMLRMSYKHGEESYLDILLGAESISDFIQRTDFLAYHMRYSSTLLSDISKTTRTLSEVTENLSSMVSAMDGIRIESEKAAAELTEKLSRVDIIIAELNADVAGLNAALSQKEADRARLESDVAALARTIAEQEAKNRANGVETAPAYDGGQLGWPLKGYSMKSLTSSYGTRTDPITGKKGAFHNGLDVGAPHGTNILAAESGTIVRASNYGTYGKCVIIDHGGGLMTLYAHCSAYNGLVVGQKVQRGEVIAYVGSTGRSTGNHLHFTVFINGKTVDPGDYLS